jgi:hypothetical protein
MLARIAWYFWVWVQSWVQKIPASYGVDNKPAQHSGSLFVLGLRHVIDVLADMAEHAEDDGHDWRINHIANRLRNQIKVVNHAGIVHYMVRAYRKWPRSRRTAEKSDELAPPHYCPRGSKWGHRNGKN